ERLGLARAAAAEKQLAECGEGRRPAGVETKRAAQQLLRCRGIAECLLGAREQAQRLDEVGVGVDDRLELIVRGAETPAPQQLTDAPHGVDERGGRYGHRLADPAAEP